MPRLGHVFAPRDRVYFELFEEAGQNVVRAAELLDRMLTNYPDSSELAARSSTASTRAIGSPTTSSIASTTRS